MTRISIPRKPRRRRPAGRLHGRIRRITPGALLVLASGCFATPVTEKLFYDLTLPPALTQGIGNHRLALGRFSASPGYDSDQIAYRVKDNELRYYGYKRWVAEPPKLLAEAVLRHLRASKYFDRVDFDDRMTGADGLLSANIEALEELDNETETRARLALSFVLRATDSDAVLLRHAFDEKQVCSRHPQDIAKTVSQILRLQMKSLSKRIAKSLARRKEQP